MELFAVAVLALAGANVLFVIVLATRRLVLGGRERRRGELEERLRPLVIRLLEEDRTTPPLSARESPGFAAILGRYARRVRGDASTRIARFFEENGGLGSALGRLDDRRSWVRAEAA